MADDPLHELLSSPLEPDRPDRRRDRRRQPSSTGRIGPWLPLGIALGALAVVVGVLVGGEDTPPPATTPPTTSTTTTVPPPSAAPVLPSGFTPVADGRLGIRVERVLVRPDAVFVTVSTVVPSGLDGEESAGFTGALWELQLVDGRSVASATESRSAASPGFVTIRFESADFDAEDIDALRMVGLASRLGDDFTAAGTTTVTLTDEPDTPVTVPVTPESLDLDVGVTLALGDIVFQDGTGSLEWHLEGADGDARAAMFPELTITDTTTDTVYLAGAGGGFGGFVFNPSGVSFYEEASLARSDEVTFHPRDEAGFPTGVPLRFDMRLSVAWDVYMPTDAVIPIDDALVAEL